MGRPVKLSETVDGNLKAPATNTSGTIGNTSNTGSTQIQFTGFVEGGSANTGYASAQKGSTTFKITTSDGTGEVVILNVVEPF